MITCIKTITLIRKINSWSGISVYERFRCCKRVHWVRVHKRGKEGSGWTVQAIARREVDRHCSADSSDGVVRARSRISMAGQRLMSKLAVRNDAARN